jgi:hypothetical protein
MSELEQEGTRRWRGLARSSSDALRLVVEEDYTFKSAATAVGFSDQALRALTAKINDTCLSSPPGSLTTKLLPSKAQSPSTLPVRPATPFARADGRQSVTEQRRLKVDPPPLRRRQGYASKRVAMVLDSARSSPPASRCWKRSTCSSSNRPAASSSR